MRFRTSSEILSASLSFAAFTLVAACSTPSDPAPNPYATPLVCTSKTNWTGGDMESPFMHPGTACIACHLKPAGGPRYAVAGTLYPTAHEPDDCNGVSFTSAPGAQVIITDANGMVHTLDPNDVGSFYFESSSFAYPYKAKVVYQGRERVMATEQKDGDCNTCHTQDGTQAAPGRIMLP